MSKFGSKPMSKFGKLQKPYHINQFQAISQQPIINEQLNEPLILNVDEKQEKKESPTLEIQNNNDSDVLNSDVIEESSNDDVNTNEVENDSNNNTDETNNHNHIVDSICEEINSITISESEPITYMNPEFILDFNEIYGEEKDFKLDNPIKPPPKLYYVVQNVINNMKMHKQTINGWSN